MATSATLIWNSWKSNLHPHRKGTQRIPPAKIITGNIMKMLEASSLQLPKTWIGEVSLKPRQGSASPQSAWDIGVHDHASVLQCHPWQYFHGQYWILLDTIGYYWILLDTLQSRYSKISLMFSWQGSRFMQLETPRVPRKMQVTCSQCWSMTISLGRPTQLAHLAKPGFLELD